MKNNSREEGRELEDKRDAVELNIPLKYVKMFKDG